MVEEKARMVDEKERMIQEKERFLQAKDDEIVRICESSDIAKALADIKKPRPVRKWGEGLPDFRFF